MPRIIGLMLLQNFFFNIPLPGISGKESFPGGDLEHLVYLGFLSPVSRVTSEIKLVDSFVVFWKETNRF